MLNRTPPSNTSNVLNSYRKRRQQRGPFLVYGAIALTIIGVILLIVWLMGPSQPLSGLFPTETPTPTLTFTPTNTPIPTNTPTITLTPTETVAPTPSEPFPYTVQEGDSVSAIAEKFNLGVDGVSLILFLNPYNAETFIGIDPATLNIIPGEIIQLPNPGMELPTATPLPPDLLRGTKIEYAVQAGDTVAGIAARFNSKTEDIVALNKLENENALNIGQVLQIPVNLVTATATLPPTSTPVTPTIEGQPSPTVTTAASGSAACDFTENNTFVTELGTLINNARTSSGLPALILNNQLTAAAKAQAVDLLCTNLLKHEGSDGSTPQSRVTAQGFTASLVVEDIYAAQGGTPQSAFNWLNNDPAHKADLLNANTTVFGIAYVSSNQSMLGGYFVVVSAKP